MESLLNSGSANHRDIREEKEDVAADMTEEKSFKDLDEDKKEELDRFFKNMVQSLLRIGYYDPEHPESMKINARVATPAAHPCEYGPDIGSYEIVSLSVHA